ncbi:hypothetical protein PISL3812_03078 [Talaromyces islandicus]|uniref:Uncharacterized protein n=1 Tax=Talaromyces islandicus TaxID=28573 RepID=A0A0U1LS21_TALIS|nr:hypothetical protein PISL3812_03078 [Talaromyces islandicus]
MGHALMFRLLKGPFASYVDEKLGSSMFLKMIDFMKTASLENGDKIHRAATIVEQMWNVDNMFKDANGNWNISLRIKHRLSAGVVHEIGIRWREKHLMDRPGGIRQDIADMPPQATTIHSAQSEAENEQNNVIDSIDMNPFTEPLTGFLGEFDFDLDDFLDSQFI